MTLGPFGIVAHAPSISSANGHDNRNNLFMIKRPSDQRGGVEGTRCHPAGHSLTSG
jgi:hypothetical protein